MVVVVDWLFVVVVVEGGSCGKARFSSRFVAVGFKGPKKIIELFLVIIITLRAFNASSQSILNSLLEFIFIDIF